MEKEAKLRECFSLRNTHQTLVSRATHADISVCWLTLVRTLFSFKHQTRWWNSVRRRASASVASYVSSSVASVTTDARCVWCTTDGRVWWVLDGSDLTSPCLSSDGRAASVAMDPSVGVKITIGNLTAQDMWRPRERQMLDAASVAWWQTCLLTSRFWITALFEGYVYIYVLANSRASYLAFWHTCEHLELSQCPQTSPDLSPCIRLRFLSEIEWFKCIDHCFAFRGTWGIDLLRDFLLLLVVAAT
jgi:hypothetical protein